MNIPVFDLHCDTVTELISKNLSPADGFRRNELHIDLKRGAALPGYAQCFAFWSTPEMPLPKNMKVQDLFWKEVSLLQEAIDKNSNMIRQARSTEDIRNNLAKGIISAVFSLEGTACIGYDPGKLEKLWNIGFRISTLGWNEKNCLTGSNVTGGGLTEQGMAYVQEAQRLGILIDVSHISDEAFWQIMDMTQAPVIASHSNSRAVCDVSRNLTDEMFLAIVGTGGVAGFNLCAPFIGETPSLENACDHILHFLDLDPTGKHIALGGDLDGITAMPEGFTGVQDYPKIAQKLLERGVDEGMLWDIFWNNAIGVMENAVRNNPH